MPLAEQLGASLALVPIGDSPLALANIAAYYSYRPLHTAQCASLSGARRHSTSVCNQLPALHYAFAVHENWLPNAVRMALKRHGRRLDTPMKHRRFSVI